MKIKEFDIKYQESLIETAIRNDDYKFLKYLFNDEGISPNIDAFGNGNLLLDVCNSKQINFNILNIILEAGADVNFNDGYCYTMEYLLNWVNKKSNFNDTLKMIELFYKHGLNLTLFDSVEILEDHKVSRMTKKMYNGICDIINKNQPEIFNAKKYNL